MYQEASCIPTTVGLVTRIPIKKRLSRSWTLLATAVRQPHWPNGSRPKPVEFVIPAGTGGGADQMARFIQGMVCAQPDETQPMVVVNKSGSAGGKGFLYVKDNKKDHTRSSLP